MCHVVMECCNPKTGEKMLIPATHVPAFSPGKLFKEKVAPDE
jgi:DNA-binding protein HU-beta